MLKVENLHVDLAGIEILRGVSIQVERGTMVALVGRNGAGKTTTFKTVMGYYKPRSGEIYVDGSKVTHMPTHLRAKIGIGYVPEDMRVYPWLSVRENIELAIKISGKMDKIQDIYERIYMVFPEIKSLLDRKGFYLSGGEKRMVAIARAMALEPKYILLDEALEGLAPIVVERFRKAVNMLREQDIGVLIAESNFSLASKIAPELYIIERGEIIFKGSPSEAKASESIMRLLAGV